MGTSDTATLRIRAEQRAIVKALQEKIEIAGGEEPQLVLPHLEARE